jgi:hypothetical protein
MSRFTRIHKVKIVVTVFVTSEKVVEFRLFFGLAYFTWLNSLLRIILSQLGYLRFYIFVDY